MDEPRIRRFWNTVRAPGGDVLVNFQEEYSSENPDQPVRAKVVARGMVTEGDLATAWRNMQKLLGIAPAPEESHDAANPQRSEAPDNPTESGLPQTAAEELLAPPPQALPSAESPCKPGDLPSQESVQLEKVEPQPEERPQLAHMVRNNLANVLESRLEVTESVEREQDSEYNPEPASEITAKQLADINGLPSAADAASFIDDLRRSLHLEEMRDDAARRAANLNYLQKANRARRCQHVKFTGSSCGAPALRGHQYCRFHEHAHAPSIDIPIIEDARSLQLAFRQLANQVAANKIEPAQAKVLLQILESAAHALQNPNLGL